MVPDELAAKSGLTKDHARRKSKYGGGYPVFVEGLHQLHCLVRSNTHTTRPNMASTDGKANGDAEQNLLRKSLFYNYDYYHSRGEGAFSDPERVQRWHVCEWLPFFFNSPINSRLRMLKESAKNSTLSALP